MSRPFHERARLRRRGTASVEVLMMLPFFLIAYWGLYYMHGRYLGRQQALLRARSCTWTYAAEGCRWDDEEHKNKLLSCLKDKTSASEASAPDQPDDSADSGDTPPVDREQVGAGKGVAILDKLKKVPLIGGAVLWLFGKPVMVTAHKRVHLKETMVADEAEVVNVAGRYYTMCNTVPRDWGKVAEDVFCEFVGDFPGCPDK